MLQRALLALQFPDGSMNIGWVSSGLSDCMRHQWHCHLAKRRLSVCKRGENVFPLSQDGGVTVAQSPVPLPQGPHSQLQTFLRAACACEDGVIAVRVGGSLTSQWFPHRPLWRGRQFVHSWPALLHEQPLQRPLPLHR